MSDEKTAEILLQLYQMNVDRGKHHQDQRSTVANLLLVLASGLIVLIALDQKITSSDVSPALFVSALGIFGAIWSAKQHERYVFYEHRAQEYMFELAHIVPTVNLRRTQSIADLRTKAKYPVLYEQRVWRLWVALYLFLFGLGLVLIMLSIDAALDAK